MRKLIAIVMIIGFVYFSNIGQVNCADGDPALMGKENIGLLMNKGSAAMTSFAGTISSSGTTVTFSSAADAILAGYSATSPVLGTTLVVASTPSQTRYITAWSDATNCTVSTAPSPAWSGDTITSTQLPIVEWKKSDGTIGGIVNAAGNVGIGTASPGTDVDITKSGQVDFTLKSTDNEAYLIMDSPVNNTANIYFKSVGVNKWNIGKDGITGDLRIGRNGGSYIQVLGASGLVGINTTTPAGKLHTVLTATAPALFGGDTVQTLTDVTTAAGAATLTDAGATHADFTTACAVGDIVVLTSATSPDEGVYVITIVTENVITLDRNLANTVPTADGYVVEDAIVIETDSGSGKPRIVLPLQNDAVTPTLAFGDGKYGIYSGVNNELYVAVNGAVKLLINSVGIRAGSGATSPGLLNETPSATNPVIVPSTQNLTVGIGSAAWDQLSSIVGSIEAQRWIETDSKAYSAIGGTGVADYTACTFPTANKDYVNKTGIGTALTGKLGSLVMVTGGTGISAGLKAFRAIAIIGADSIQVDRAIHAEVGDIVDGTVTVMKDVVLIGPTDGTLGNRIMGYSAQDKPLQIGGDTLAATGHSLGAEDVLVGGNITEFNGITHFDNTAWFWSTSGVNIVNTYLAFYYGAGKSTLLKSAPDDGLLVALNDVEGGDNNHFIITTTSNNIKDHDHEDLSTNPTVFIHSALDPDTSNNQWGSFAHDQSNFVLSTGLNTGVGTGATTINNGILIAPQTLTADAAGQYGMKVTRTLNDGTASGSGTFNLIEGDITATAAGGWGTVNLMDLKYDTVSKFSVSSIGSLIITGIATIGSYLYAAGGVNSNAAFSTQSIVTMLIMQHGFSNTDNAVEMVYGTHTQGTGESFNGVAIIPTYNQTSTASATDLLINRTETAVGTGAQLLIDAQVGSASKFSVSNTGSLNTAPATITAGSGSGITVNSTGNVNSQVYKVTTTYAAYTDSDTTKGIVIATLPAKTKILAVYTDTTTPYTGGSTNAATMVVGITAESAAEIIASHDVFAGAVTAGLADADMGTSMTRAAAIQGGYLPSWSGTTAIYATLVIATDILSNLTAGSTTFYIETERY
ncbi:MAG: hypothetical protein ABIL06_13350 [Pseudomonadota bacterium]